MPTLFQINTTVNTGSTGRIAEEIGEIVLNDGWSSYIAYGKAARESRSHVVRIGNEWDMKMHALTTRLFDNHGFASTRSTRSFINELDKIRPDIVQLHNLHGYYLNIEILFEYLKRIQVPIVWTLHDCWPMTGHCSYFDYVNCNKWRVECNVCPNLKGYPMTYFDYSKRNFYKKKNLFTSLPNITFVTPSEWLKNIVLHSFLSDYPVKVIHNGTDLSIFKPIEKHGIKSKFGIGSMDKLILGVASVWDRRKGLSDFIELSKILKNNEHILLVGLDDKQHAGLPSNITAIKRTENMQELATLYASADVFVNPTWVDNFPTTNIEALACGTPVVTYRTGGSPEAVSPETGGIVEKGNIQNLYQVISAIWKIDKKQFILPCRRRAENYFNKDDRYSDYLELYKSLL